MVESPKPECDLCGENQADGFLQLYDVETGEPLPGVGPNVCGDCAAEWSASKEEDADPSP